MSCPTCTHNKVQAITFLAMAVTEINRRHPETAMDLCGEGFDALETVATDVRNMIPELNLIDDTPAGRARDADLFQEIMADLEPFGGVELAQAAEFAIGLEKVVRIVRNALVCAVGTLYDRDPLLVPEHTRAGLEVAAEHQGRIAALEGLGIPTNLARSAVEIIDKIEVVQRADDDPSIVFRASCAPGERRQG